MPTTPEISVLLPLQEERKVGLECIRAWSNGQTLAPERYELILIAGGLDLELEVAARELAGANIVMVETGAEHEWDCFNAGAGAARGTYLFLTEAHCVPEPDCLEAMLEELDGLPGVRGRSVGVSQTALGALEQRFYEDDLRVGEDSSSWRKVLIHSMAIRRDVYLQTGGFDGSLGDFAGWAMSIALREAGHMIPYRPGPAVRHQYTGELRELRAHIEDFVAGELRFLIAQPELGARYLSEPPELTNLHSFTRSGALRVLRAAWASGLGNFLQSVSLRDLTIAAAGTRTALFSAGVSVIWQRSRISILRGARRETAFRDFWRACARKGRLSWLSKNAHAVPDRPPGDSLDIGAALPRGTSGVSGAEVYGGEQFRWTERLALIPLMGPPTDEAWAVLRALPLRPVNEMDRMTIVVNGTKVPVESNGSPYQFRFPLPGGRVRWIGISCPPIQRSRLSPSELRELSIPLTVLAVEETQNRAH